MPALKYFSRKGAKAAGLQITFFALFFAPLREKYFGDQGASTICIKQKLVSKTNL